MNPGHDREKIVNIEERIPKIKEQRKQKANRRLISFIMLFFIMVLIIVYLQTPISKVSTISVTGNENVSKKEIIDLSDINSGDTEFWSLDKQKTEKKIQQNKLVKKAEISKSLPNKINIAIEEYKAIAYLEKDDVYYEVLENGSVLPNEVTPDDARTDFSELDKREEAVSNGQAARCVVKFVKTVDFRDLLYACKNG